MSRQHGHWYTVAEIFSGRLQITVDFAEDVVHPCDAHWRLVLIVSMGVDTLDTASAGILLVLTSGARP